MNTTGYSPKTLNSYLIKFQEAQSILNDLIKEERIQKRIARSRKKLQRIYD